MKTILATLICFCTQDLMTQPSSEQIQSYLDSVQTVYQIPALAGGIMVDGQIRWTGAAGAADLEGKIPAEVETRFRIASVTKVLTAALVLKLEELGDLDLQAPVQTYLPDYPEPKKGEMRVIHLLQHTAGVRHSKGAESRSFEHYVTQRDACRIFEADKLRFEPGTDYRYSSFGFTVLGAVIEAVTGTPYYEALRIHILSPAGMEDTALDDRSIDNPAVARLYKKSGTSVAPDADNDLSLIYAAGGLVSTVGDLLRFVNALETGKLISMDRVQRMLVAPIHAGKVLDEHAGLGWNISTLAEYGQVCFRVGGQSGCSALLLSYRDAGVTAVLLSNQAVLDPIWEITNQLIGWGLAMR
ncbi:MAG: serine hydrolase domain-containing protein [Saprospiraceae bacterium]|nr:serine hydrolase domain-containing protein [Saprospiraceae bacterium]